MKQMAMPLAAVLCIGTAAFAEMRPATPIEAEPADWSVERLIRRETQEMNGIRHLLDKERADRKFARDLWERIDEAGEVKPLQSDEDDGPRVTEEQYIELSRQWYKYRMIKWKDGEKDDEYTRARGFLFGPQWGELSLMGRTLLQAKLTQEFNAMVDDYAKKHKGQPPQPPSEKEFLKGEPWRYKTRP